MTRKDFELIARALKQGTDFAVYRDSERARTQHALQCSAMAHQLMFCNANFNRVRFLQACGLTIADIEAL